MKGLNRKRLRIMWSTHGQIKIQRFFKYTEYNLENLSETAQHFHNILLCFINNALNKL